MKHVSGIALSFLLSMGLMGMGTAGFCDSAPICRLNSETICGSGNSFVAGIEQAQAKIQADLPYPVTLEGLKAFYSSAYTNERIQKVRHVLDAVKESARKTISSRSAGKFTSQLLAAIDQAEVRFDPPPATEGGKGVEELPHAVARLTALNARTTSDRRINIGGLILLVDQSPDLLFQVLAHEMGHVVGPTFLFVGESCHCSKFPEVKPFDQSYDFSGALQCVSRKVKEPDFGCYLKKADQLARIPGADRKAEQIRKLVPKWQENPFVIVQEVLSTGCQMGQSEESFADLFSAEILSTRMSGESNPVQALQKYLGFFCYEQRRQANEGFNTSGPYPQMGVRIDDILLSNETLRSSLRASMPECTPASTEGLCRL